MLLDVENNTFGQKKPVQDMAVRQCFLDENDRLCMVVLCSPFKADKNTTVVVDLESGDLHQVMSSLKFHPVNAKVMY